VPNIAFRKITHAPYARTLRQHLSAHEPTRLIDALIIAALIEARSCERFWLLAPHLDEKLKQFYQGLYQAEGRHFHIYLNLAKKYAPQKQIINQRIAYLTHIEQQLICHQEQNIRFHSGIPTDD